MKIKWKKINRGLILGAILLIGLIVFIIVKKKQFDKEKPVIVDTCIQYTKDLLALSLVPEEAVVGAPYTEKDQKKMRVAFDTLADTYWQKDLRPEEIDGLSIEMLRTSFREEYLSGKCQAVYKNLSIMTPEVEIISDGPNDAIARVQLYSVTFEYVGYSMATPYFHQPFFDNWMDETETEKEYKATYAGSLELHMERVKGNWKINWLYSSLYGTNVDDVAKTGDGYVNLIPYSYLHSTYPDDVGAREETRRDAE